MNDAEKQRILNEARETIARVDRLPPRDETVQPPSMNRLDAWRQSVLRQEAEFAEARRKRAADGDAERIASERWQAWIQTEIRNCMVSIGTALGEHMAETNDKIADALDRRDRTISKLEVELARTQAELARLTVRVVGQEVEQDRKASGGAVVDLPAWPRKTVNLTASRNFLPGWRESAGAARASR
jgi:hypothetical protein